jgi:hypothetical protein
MFPLPPAVRSAMFWSSSVSTNRRAVAGHWQKR